jgi:hypothetical protein
MEKHVKAASDHGVEQREFVVVVVVESSAIDGCGFGDVLDGDVFEGFRLQKGLQGSLKKLAGAADSGIANFAVGDGHGNSLIQSTKLFLMNLNL